MTWQKTGERQCKEHKKRKRKAKSSKEETKKGKK